ncbi:unannotated protein [freshwater metagenome]|uniref:Unannotated protein n=1 Tax=freshwater metagenome TaxID=449393 RepID=A0A6J7K7T9_9ZZZZ
MSVPRNGDHDDVARARAPDVVVAAHVADDLVGHRLSAFGTAAANHHAEARLGPSGREASSLLARAPEDPDGH